MDKTAAYIIASAFKHLYDGRAVRIEFEAGAAVEPCAGSLGIVVACEALFGDDSDLVKRIILRNEPAPKPHHEREYVAAIEPLDAVDNADTEYLPIFADSDEEAMNLAQIAAKDAGRAYTVDSLFHRID